MTKHQFLPDDGGWSILVCSQPDAGGVYDVLGRIDTFANAVYLDGRPAESIPAALLAQSPQAVFEWVDAKLSAT